MTDAQKQELDRLIEKIEAHRASLKLSDSRFATRFAKYVGSPKTWESRLKPRKWGELRGENWLAKLRRFVNEIDGSVGDQEIYDNLPIVGHGMFLYDTLQTKTNDRRNAILMGPKGTGKTLTLRHIQKVNDFKPVFMSANETWRDSRMCIASNLASVINAPVKMSASFTFQSCIDKLKEEPLTILIDEAHEGGVLLMKLVKSIINETQAKVILGIYPTGWRRLISGANDAYDEAQQLLRRTIRPVSNRWARGVNDDDVQEWCKAVKFTLSLARIKELLPTIQKHGNYSLLADALERSNVIADEGEGAVTQDLFCQQIVELAQERKQEKKSEES